MLPKPLIIALFFTFFAKCAFADEPPCWCKFKIESKNKQFYAVVDRPAEDSLKSPWLSIWTLSVYENSLAQSKLLWKTTYNYYGYPDGFLSDDGKYFVYLEYWYHAKGNLLEIYKNGSLIKSGSLTGDDFKVTFGMLKKTTSHWLWLTGEGGAAGFQKGSTGTVFMVKTIDDKVHWADLDKGTMIK